jgi:hypothetical protein
MFVYGNEMVMAESAPVHRNWIIRQLVRAALRPLLTGTDDLNVPFLIHIRMDDRVAPSGILERRTYPHFDVTAILILKNEDSKDESGDSSVKFADGIPPYRPSN